ncbi:arylsulfatase [Algoriphagus sp. 4150]|uniref:arylsulfatase n=1 Tax=Algoriphagus sp. 4150 TaxID=2817756 RepID=UPI002856B89F|nr:arylsulfatase [Algoriphagus sp. 4150]MDR7132525.1 arylsulfatase [Algoriphagus sp. 4150]
MNILKTTLILGSVLGLGLVTSFIHQSARKDTTAVTVKPNVVLILADDLGYSDIGSYGSEIATPNLDQLAADGVRFTHFYNVGICAPTRATLLTGQYQHDAGVGYFAVNLGIPAYQGYLNENTVTIAEALKENGYKTLLSGKWHVGNDSLHWPNQRGFDEFYGFTGGASNFFQHIPFSEKPIELHRNNARFEVTDPDYYMTNAIASEAIEQVKGAGDQPFFLYLAFNAPHWPLHALPEDIEKYKGKYDEGWDVLRQDRFEGLKEKGLVSDDFKLSQRPSTIPAWESLSPQDREIWARKMEVHAAMVDNMDQNIGRLISHLKATGQFENTVFFFLSDNGAAGENTDRAATRPDPNGQPNFNQGPPDLANLGEIGTADSYTSVTHHWAYALNTPFTYWKTFPQEGGIATPFIASFPARFAGSKIVEGNGHLIDLLPTILDLTGSTYPENYHGNSILPLVGKSLVPVLDGHSLAKTDTLYFERGGNRAVKAGKWKALALKGGDDWKLYDLEKDRSEITNLAEINVEVLSQLKNSFDQWARNHHVVNTDSLLKAAPAGASMLRFEKGIESTIEN